MAIDLPLSVVAWISVVVVQAVIHYIVLGFRPRRQDDGDVIVNEIESTASTQEAATESIIASDDGLASTGTSPYADIVSLVDSAEDDDADENDCGCNDDATASTAGMSNDRSPRPSVDFAVHQPQEFVLRRSLYTVIRNEDLWDGDEPPDFMEIVTQTGSELLKVSQPPS